MSQQNLGMRLLSKAVGLSPARQAPLCQGPLGPFIRSEAPSPSRQDL